jgi:hypothetical protein
VQCCMQHAFLCAWGGWVVQPLLPSPYRVSVYGACVWRMCVVRACVWLVRALVCVVCVAGVRVCGACGWCVWLVWAPQSKHHDLPQLPLANLLKDWGRLGEAFPLYQSLVDGTKTQVWVPTWLFPWCCCFGPSQPWVASSVGGVGCVLVSACVRVWCSPACVCCR